MTTISSEVQYGLAITGFSLLLICVVVGLLWGRWLALRQKQLEAQWEEFQKHRKELYDKLADPARIEADFEKSARAREMYDANRTTLPREGAGPPAKIYRPKMRGKKPGNWRIQRP